MSMHYVMKSINVLNCLLMLAVAAGAYAVIVPFLNLTIPPTPSSRRNNRNSADRRSLQPCRTPPRPITLL